jgi:hypothetical protein
MGKEKGSHDKSVGARKNLSRRDFLKGLTAVGIGATGGAEHPPSKGFGGTFRNGRNGCLTAQSLLRAQSFHRLARPGGS